jgi:hypothetical protein
VPTTRAAVAAWREREDDRQAKLAAAQGAYDEGVAATVADVEAQNAEVDAFRASVEAGEPDAVVDYFNLVLERSRYPGGFPKGRRSCAIVAGDHHLGSTRQTWSRQRGVTGLAARRGVSAACRVLSATTTVADNVPAGQLKRSSSGETSWTR